VSAPDEDTVAGLLLAGNHIHTVDCEFCGPIEAVTLDTVMTPIGEASTHVDLDVELDPDAYCGTVSLRFDPDQAESLARVLQSWARRVRGQA
jgi:hypothetical protein